MAPTSSARSAKDRGFVRVQYVGKRLEVKHPKLDVQALFLEPFGFIGHRIGTSAEIPINPFFYDTPGEVYRRWQKREEAKDQVAEVAHNKLIIENRGPECERVIATLEEEWLEDNGRI